MSTLFAPPPAFENRFLSESHKVFRAMTTPQTNARKYLINTLISSLKTAGVWTKLDCLYVLAAADSQAALVNWKNPGTFNLTAAGSPTFSADDGYTGDASSASLATGFTPSTAGGSYTQDSAHIGAWVLNDITSTSAYSIAHISGSTPQAIMRPRSTATQAVWTVNNATAVTTATVTTSAGHTMANRSAADAQQIYKDGAELGTSVGASTGLPTSAIHLLRGFSSFSAHQVAAAHIGGSLGADEVGDLYDALSAYLTAVGAI